MLGATVHGATVDGVSVGVRRSTDARSTDAPSTETPPTAYRFIAWHSFHTPMGRMHIAATGRGLCRVTWRMEGPDELEEELVLRFPGRPIVHDPAALGESEREISEYFTGRRTSFDLSTDLTSLGDFERRVLQATQRVPYGSTVSYSQIAERIGRPRAARAVGNALRNNPVPLVVPCHRIVRADGSLGGYGGPDRTREKERLLHLESRA